MLNMATLELFCCEPHRKSDRAMFDLLPLPVFILGADNTERLPEGVRMKLFNAGVYISTVCNFHNNILSRPSLRDLSNVPSLLGCKRVFYLFILSILLQLHA